MKPIYFKRADTYKVSNTAPFLDVTEEDVSTKKKFLVEDRYADMTVGYGAAAYYEAEEIAKKETSKPAWQAYLEKNGANTVSEKEYLIDICIKLGIKPSDAEKYKRKDFKKVLYKFSEEKPDVLQGVVDGDIDLSVSKTDDEVFSDIMDGKEEVNQYSDILKGE